MRTIKQRTRIVSFLLSVLIIFNLGVNVIADNDNTVTPDAIKSISINDLSIIENQNGEYVNLNYVYHYRPDYSVTLNDGRVIKADGDSIVTIDGVNHLLNITDSQSEEYWNVGNTYQATGEIDGVTATFNVSIIQNPISYLDVEHQFLLFEQNGYDDNGYYHYNLLPSITVALLSGEQIKVCGTDVKIEGTYYPITVTDNQSEEHWTEGNTYQSVVSVAGLSYTYNVSIISADISDVAIDDITLIENSEGRSIDDVFYYSYIPSFTVTFKDGRTRQSDLGQADINGNWVRLFTTDTQSETPWTVGNTYQVTGSICGVTSTFNVTIIKNPIASLSVGDVTLIKNSNGWDNGQYYQYGYNPSITATMKDGSVINLSENGFNVLGYKYTTSYIDSQYSNHWTAGNTYKVTLWICGMSADFNVTIIESPVVSITVDDISLTVNTDGYSVGSYFHYNYYPDVTAVLNDGTSVVSGGNMLEIDGVPYQITFTDTQEDAPWTVGNTYQATASFCGVSCVFNVSITGSVVASITAHDITVTEKTSGFYDGGQYHYMCTPDITVVLNDGTTKEISYGMLEINDKQYYANVSDDQYNTVWTAGHTYQATVELLGRTSTYNVTIIPSKIESITINDIEITEGLDYDTYQGYVRYTYTPVVKVKMKDGQEYQSYNGYVYIDGETNWITFTDTQEQNHWTVGNTYQATGEIQGFIAQFNVTVKQSPIESITADDITIIERTGGTDMGDYYSYYYTPSLTVKFKNGTTEQNVSSVEYNNINYWSQTNDNQSDAHWTVGNTYQVTVTLMGKSCVMNVTIVHSPIASVAIDDTTVISKADGQSSYDGKFIYNYYPSFTVTFKDGTTQKSSDNSIEYNGRLYYLSITDTQDTSEWLNGNTYKVTGEIMGVTDEFNVSVIDNPVRSVSISPVVLMDGIDNSYNDYNNMYEYQVSCLDFTVTMNDGSVYKSNGNDYIVYNGKTYIMDYTIQDMNPKVGHTYTVPCTFMGKESSFKVSIKANAYNKMEIYEDDTLYITFERNDGTKEKYRVLSFEEHMGSLGMCGGKLVTDSRVFNATFNYLITPNQTDDKSKDLILCVGKLTSNALLKCNWLKNYLKAQNSINVIYAYNEMLQNSNENRLFNLDKDNYNLDDLINVACNISGIMYYQQDMDDVDAYVDIDTVKEYIKEVFGITSGYDLTKASGYDKNTGLIKVKVFNQYQDAIQFNLTYKDGKYSVYNSSDEDEYKICSGISVGYDENGTIKKIVTNPSEYTKTGVGDVNSDGQVNGLDRLILTRYLENWQNYPSTLINMQQADINKDGKVDNEDRIILTKYLANWESTYIY